MKYQHFIICLLCVVISNSLVAQKETFSYKDVFSLEHVKNPQIAPDGKVVVYRRMGFDIMKDRAVGQLWLINVDGTEHQKLSAREVSEYGAKWSPSGDRLVFVSSTNNGSEIYMYWRVSGRIAKISQLPFSPSALTWSRDGSQLAFSMHVPKKPLKLAKMPKKPKGAQWAATPRITNRIYHEADGLGYIQPGFNHIFVIPTVGGAIRQITSGDFHHKGALSWSLDNSKIYFSGNRNADWEYSFRNSEVYAVHTQNGIIETLTNRNGPDTIPVVSPDGKYIAYIGYADKVQAYQVRSLHIMSIDGTHQKSITNYLDRSVSNLVWDTKSTGVYFKYDDKGNSKIAHITLSGKHTVKAHNVGGTTIGRPYASGSFSISNKGTIAYTQTSTEEPSELAILNYKAKKPIKITHLNDALLGYRNLGEVKEVWYTSSVDQRKIQGWVVYPPNYDASKKYPFLVENHGGPILNYGDRFSVEMQLYAAAGYIVFYPNPRGSTSYGEEFANLLYNNYPGEDYNDVMDGVDYCIAKGIAYEDQLFVTGGSAGGIMTAWMIGKNNRFKAAVVVKPVMNWISKTLVADNYFGYANSRYPGQPWENFEGYWKFSPLSLVGNIETPTMVMVGMNDLRTPPSEAKQLYHALKLQKKETVLVEIPGASHGIAKRPSNLITKVAHTLAWLAKYNKQKE